jgi:hypothetical protein
MASVAGYLAAPENDLVAKVDFPSFVQGLIQGTFQAIVDASIEQMDAYGKLIAEAAASVDQFAKDRITDDKARHVLDSPQAAGRLPGLKKARTPAERLRLARRRQAADRQQLLATMVLMGINRIVVTDSRAAQEASALR